MAVLLLALLGTSSIWIYNAFFRPASTILFPRWMTHTVPAIMLFFFAVFWLPGCFDILFDTLNSNDVLYCHPNAVGSIKIITGKDGTVKARYRYLPYGEMLTAHSSGTDATKYKYTAQEADDSTGLYYYNARYYDPAIGRFISADTVVPDPADTQAFNRYMYCGGNPICYNDPSGHGEDDDYIDGGTLPPLVITGHRTQPNGRPEGAPFSSSGYNTPPVPKQQIQPPIPSSYNNGTSFPQILIAGVVGDFGTAIEYSFNCDFGMDYFGEIPGYWNQGDYLRIALSITAGAAEATYDTLAMEYIISEFLSALRTPAAKIAKSIEGEMHHIASNKAIKSGFTDAYEKIFEKAGLNLGDDINKVFLAGHKGGHTIQYKRYVLRSLRDATKGLTGDAFKANVIDTLNSLRQQLFANPRMPFRGGL